MRAPGPISRTETPEQLTTTRWPQSTARTGTTIGELRGGWVEEAGHGHFINPAVKRPALAKATSAGPTCLRGESQVGALGLEPRCKVTTSHHTTLSPRPRQSRSEPAEGGGFLGLPHHTTGKESESKAGCPRSLCQPALTESKDSTEWGKSERQVLTPAAL